MQQYIPFAEVEVHGLQLFDSWARTFGETQTAIELATDGTGYRAKTRFSVSSPPELMVMFWEVMDLQTASI